jgi:hypothetical protein
LSQLDAAAAAGGYGGYAAALKRSKKKESRSKKGGHDQDLVFASYFLLLASDLLQPRLSQPDAAAGAVGRAIDWGRTGCRRP